MADFTVDFSNFKVVEEKIFDIVAKDEAVLFANVYKNAIALRLRSISASKNSLITGESLREEIISSMSPVIETENGASFSISHPLSIALDQGTGMYNPESPHRIYPTRASSFAIPIESLMNKESLVRHIAKTNYASLPRKEAMRDIREGMQKQRQLSMEKSQKAINYNLQLMRK